MWDIIKRLMSQGTTILLTTQYLEEADQLADQIVLIDGGKVVAEGTAAELKSKVGKDRLVLTFAQNKQVQDAARVLETHGGVAHPETLQVALPIEHPTEVKTVLELLQRHKIAVASLDIHKPTLDDVFLAVTKKPTGAGKEDV